MWKQKETDKKYITMTSFSFTYRLCFFSIQLEKTIFQFQEKCYDKKLKNMFGLLFIVVEVQFTGDLWLDSFFFVCNMLGFYFKFIDWVWIFAIIVGHECELDA